MKKQSVIGREPFDRDRVYFYTFNAPPGYSPEEILAHNEQFMRLTHPSSQEYSNNPTQSLPQDTLLESTVTGHEGQMRVRKPQ